MMKFNVENSDGQSGARAGKLITEHGTIETPIFMPVGTRGTVKTLTQDDLENDVKAQIILGNTYHLYLRPGLDILESQGGLHSFMDWHRPILTDSGGYQVYSLSHRREITSKGVNFCSHIDGAKHFFSPEKAIDIQRIIGADVIMAFDECTPYPCEKKYAANSMRMTHDWLDRCFVHMEATEDKYGYCQTLAPIVQGSIYPDLRKESAQYIAEKGAEINAIGGLSVGEPHEDMYAMTEIVTNILPKDKARYLMGVGTPANILECISRGIDMFDCVLPTRNARHGLIYTQEGVINIKNACWKNEKSPLDASGVCGLSLRHSKAYVRHLFSVNEYYGIHIASKHNLAFFLWLVKTAREKIISGEFSTWKNAILPKLDRRLKNEKN